MHLIVDELLTKEQLESPKRYIYQMCEMYGWEPPAILAEEGSAYRLMYVEKSKGKARKRQRLIQDACIRLGTKPLENFIEPSGRYILVNDTSIELYYCQVLIPKYNKAATEL